MGPRKLTHDQDTAIAAAESRARNLTKLLGDAPAPDAPPGALHDYISDLADEGCAVLFIHPGGKRPADMRPANVRREARRSKSPSGVKLATGEPKTLHDYLTRYRTLHGDDVAVNLGVAAGRSRLLIVDCDTPEQVAAFLADAGADPGTPPTVNTPRRASRHQPR